MDSTSTSMPRSISAGTVQNQVFRDQHIHGDQIFNPRSDAGQALVRDCLKSLAYPEMNDRSNTIRISTGGTCEWLLQHKIWKRWKSSQRGLLWIKGKPGSGKSTLLGYALQELKSTRMANKALILSFFFHGRGNDLQKNQLGLFRSLLHQLLSEMPDELTKLVTTFEQRQNGIGRPGVNWTWELDELRELFKRSTLDILKSRPVWIFVDALDESGAENAKAVIRHFKDLLQGPPTRSKLQICFACRHYPVQSWEGGLEICTEHENKQDILTYLRARLSDFQVPGTFALPNLITERSDGLFIWARLVVDRILDLDLADDPNNAEGVINKIIDTLPRDLNTLYAEIVRNAEKTPASLKMVQWISCARRPLSLDELRWAMVVDPDSSHTSLRAYRNTPDYTENNNFMERKVKKLSHGLVEVIHSSQTRIVQFIHQSVKDFFDNLTEASGDSYFSVNEAAHYNLYRTCIHYLAMEEIGVALFGNRVTTDQRLKADQLALLSEYPLLSYSTTSWIAHLEGSQESYKEGLRHFSWPSQTILDRWIKSCWRLYRGMNRNDFPPAEATLVHVLARYGLVVPLQMLLGQGEPVDINADDDLGRTPLLYAAERGQEAAVQVLLAAGGDANHQDDSGASPLHFAALRGHFFIMRLLLHRGSDANQKDMDGCPPLAWAIEAKHEAAVKMLLEQGVDFNDQYTLVGCFEDITTTGRPTFREKRFRRSDDPWTAGFFRAQGLRLWGNDGPSPWVTKIERCDDALQLDNYLSPRNPLAKLFGRGHDYHKIGPRRRGAKDGDRTPLLHAVELGLKPIVSLLVWEGAHPDLECRTRWSAMLLAQLRRNPSDQDILPLLEVARRDNEITYPLFSLE